MLKGGMLHFHAPIWEKWGENPSFVRKIPTNPRKSMFFLFEGLHGIIRICRNLPFDDSTLGFHLHWFLFSSVLGLAFGLIVFLGFGLMGLVLFIWKINMDNLPRHSFIQRVRHSQSATVYWSTSIYISSHPDLLYACMHAFILHF